MNVSYIYHEPEIFVSVYRVYVVSKYNILMPICVVYYIKEIVYYYLWVLFMGCT
jgi:hypothetical protein